MQMCFQIPWFSWDYHLQHEATGNHRTALQEMRGNGDAVMANSEGMVVKVGTTKKLSIQVPLAFALCLLLK